MQGYQPAPDSVPEEMRWAGNQLCGAKLCFCGSPAHARSAAAMPLPYLCFSLSLLTLKTHGNILPSHHAGFGSKVHSLEGRSGWPVMLFAGRLCGKSNPLPIRDVRLRRLARKQEQMPPWAADAEAIPYFAFYGPAWARRHTCAWGMEVGCPAGGRI